MPRPPKQKADEPTETRVIHEPVAEPERVIHDETPTPEAAEPAIEPAAAPVIVEESAAPEPVVDRYPNAICTYCGSKNTSPQGNRRFCNSCRMPFIPY